MTVQELHDEKVQGLVEQYRQEGYDVVVEPLAETIPGFGSNLRPDLLIAKGPERIVIEVKTRGALRNSDSVRRMADALAKQPNWKFELVVLEDSAAEPSPVVDAETIHSQLSSASLLLDQGQLPSAFVLVWIATEAALRKLAAVGGLKIGEGSPVQLIREMMFNGLLDRPDYDLLSSHLNTRNRIVHGFSVPQLTKEQIQSLRDVTLRLVAAGKSQTAAA